VQKVLLSMILALFMALAVAGVKRAAVPSAGSSNGAVLMAEGGMPVPPACPTAHEGGMPVPPANAR
jgi:hypothetical protein